LYPRNLPATLAGISARTCRQDAFDRQSCLRNKAHQDTGRGPYEQREFTAASHQNQTIQRQPNWDVRAGRQSSRTANALDKARKTVQARYDVECIDECEAANLLTKDGGGSHRPFEALNPTIAKRRNADARVGKSGSFRRYSSIIARRLSGQRTPTVVACLLAGRSLFLVGMSPPDHHPARASRLDRGRLLERKPELTRRNTSSWKYASAASISPKVLSDVGSVLLPTE
jgi:hypothetical protein